VSEVPRLCLHGFLGCGADFEAWLEPRAGDIVPDLPGHGPKPDVDLLEGDPDMAFERCLDWIEAQVAAAGHRSVDLVAYSMGGRLAYGLLARGNIQICCAVLIGANPGIESDEERRTRAAADDALATSLAASRLPEWLDGWYAQPLFGDIESSDAWPETRARRSGASAPSLALALRRLGPGRQPSYWGALAAMTADQVLLVAGADDEKYVQINERAKQRIPRSATLTVDRTAHALHVERPALVGQLVSAFLA
jgi:2-succinyl-6-hydroxy-2,4-cyclohexadiene-1-carboxylate synthase